MQALWAFLVAVILCLFTAVAVYFIIILTSLRRSIDKLLPAATEVASIFPAFQRATVMLPDLIASHKAIQASTDELRKTFDKFLQVALISNRPGVAAESNGESGFYPQQSDEELAARETADRARRQGVKTEEEPSAFYIPKRGE